MPDIHPAILNHIQAMHDELADMMENPQDYDFDEPLELSLLLIKTYEDLLSHFGILEVTDAVIH